MNIIEKYHSVCGVKKGKPFVSESYFPITFDKYIVVDTRAKHNSDEYNLWNEAIGYVKRFLSEKNISIVQFAKDNSSIFSGSDKVFIMLPKKQEAFIIKNSLLTIGSDNLSVHVADALGLQSIGLYSSHPASVNKPTWSGKHIAIESERLGNLPAYGVEETPKAINFIKPEEIASHILNFFGSEDQIKHETIFIGDNYKDQVVEIVPDFVAQRDYMFNKSINVRMDLCFNEVNLIHWLEGRHVNIITNKPIAEKLIEQYHNNIPVMTIDINDSFEEEYLKKIQNLGIKLNIFCDDESKLNDFRFRFFDFDIQPLDSKTKKTVEKHLNPNTKYISKKIIVSKGAHFSSIPALKQGKQLTNTAELVYDDDEFWKELDHFRLINEKI